MTDANDIARKSGTAALRRIIDKTAIARPPPHSDEALALRFADRHAGEWRYVAAFSKWFVYNGIRWRIDETLEIFSLVRQICREASAECSKKKRLAASLASASTVMAVERLARSDRRLAATADQWDRDLWVVNTPAGVVDLRA